MRPRNPFYNAKSWSGIGIPRKVERVEEHELADAENEQLNSNGNDWDTEWSDDEKESSTSLLPNEKVPPTNESTVHTTANTSENDSTNTLPDDEEAEAWGWGDDEPEAEPSEEKAPEIQPAQTIVNKTNESVLHALRTGRLTEKYSISSIPKPVFETVVLMITDGVTLSQQEYIYPHPNYFDELC